MTSIIEAGPAVTPGPAPTPTTSTEGPTVTDSSTRRRRANWRKRLQIAGFAGPALIVYLTFVLLPVFLAAYYSFFNWNGLGPMDRFIGFDNYARVLTDAKFHQAVGNTFFVLILSLLIQGPLAISIALLFNRKMYLRSALRLLIFVPYVLSEITAGLAWSLILQPDGALAGYLDDLGLSDLKALWLADTDLVMWTMFGILTWKYLGFAIILMLAGLQGVPEELSEAAALDGANWWQVQRHVTLPLLGPTIRIWAFLSIIGSLQLFDMVWITTGGGPANASATMATYMVQFGLNRTQVGFGSAVAVVIFVISLAVALLYQRFALRRDLAGALTSRKAGS